MKLDITIRRLGVALVLAAVFAFLADDVVVPDDFAVGFFFLLWLALFLAWPYLSRTLGFPNFPSAPAPRKAALPSPKLPLGRRLVHGALMWIGGILVAMLLMSLTVIVPLSLAHRKAHRAQEGVHAGMTAPQVLHSVTGWNFLSASSDYPYPDNADFKDIPAVSFIASADKGYRTDDATARTMGPLSEEEALRLLHEKLHDGYRWRFNYTYLSGTPQHVSFSVIFGPDGKVSEVKPVHGWD